MSKTPSVAWPPDLFLDLDGVLADFEARVGELFNGRKVEDIKPSVLWSTLARQPDFFGTLALMPDALELWEFARHHNPTILTGKPRGTWADAQKVSFVRKHFGPSVPVIVCFAAEKGRFASPSAVLVDDMLKNRDTWVSSGGVFVHHTSALASIEQLRQLGYTGKST